MQKNFISNTKSRSTGDANENPTHTYLKKLTILLKFPDTIIIKDIADVNSRAGEGVRRRT